MTGVPHESSVVMALYAYAAQPERWDEVLDAISTSDQSAIPRLKAHMDQAIAISHRVADAGKAEPVAETDFGVIELSRSGVVRATNSAARAILERFVKPLAPGQSLSFSLPEHEEAFEQGKATLSENGGGPALVRFPVDAGNVLLGLLIPLTGGTEGNRAGAMADADLRLVLSPVSALNGQEYLLRRELDLTPAESRLALQLGSGETLADAAAQLRVSLNTARNQLRSIFAKTGVSRQADLIKLMIELGLLGKVLTGRRASPLERSPANDSVVKVARKFFKLADGRKLSYRLYGAAGGEPVIFFHSGFAMYVPRASDNAASVDAGIALYCVERPGFGMSDENADYSYESVAKDVASFVADKGFGSVKFLAEASGMSFALAAAKKLGPVVRAVMVTNGVPHIPKRADSQRADMPSFFYERVKQNPWFIEGFWAIFRNGFNRKVGMSFMQEFYRSCPADYAYTLDPLVQEQVLECCFESIVKSSHGAAAEMAYRVEAKPVDVSTFPCPLILWHGGLDAFTSVGEMREFAKQCPKAELHVMPERGHLVLFQCWPEIMTRLTAA